MGGVRGYGLDAVIGIGGSGHEAEVSGLARRITWVGIGAHAVRVEARRGPLLTFDHFVQFDAQGPLLETIASALAERMYQRGARFLLKGYSHAERKDAERVLEWARTQPSTVSRLHVGNMDAGLEGVHAQKHRCGIIC